MTPAQIKEYTKGDYRKGFASGFIKNLPYGLLIGVGSSLTFSILYYIYLGDWHEEKKGKTYKKYFDSLKDANQWFCYAGREEIDEMFEELYDRPPDDDDLDIAGHVAVGLDLWE